MSIADDLENAAPTPVGLVCKVAMATEEHPDLADEIRAAVMRRDRTARVISDVLARHGVELSQGIIQRHRRRECKCHF